MLRTPLHVASGKGYLKVVEVLCQYGANTHLKDKVWYAIVQTSHKNIYSDIITKHHFLNWINNGIIWFYMFLFHWNGIFCEVHIWVLKLYLVVNLPALLHYNMSS